MTAPLRRLFSWLGRLLTRPLARYILSWALLGGCVATAIYYGWIGFKVLARGDGNNGHCMVDFGGQYTMGRMLVDGHPTHLYHRQWQREVLRRAYPIEDESPKQEEHDYEALMTWFMGEDDVGAARTIGSCLLPLGVTTSPELLASLAGGTSHWTPERIAKAVQPQIGGPLYPPIHAFVMYPIAKMRPQLAYRVTQLLGLFEIFLAGWGFWVLAERRVWFPMAVTVTLAYPGSSATIELGQNPALTLAILVWGWVAMARGRETLGGVIWGLLVFKPVWLLSFFLVPLVTGRWRFCLAMIVTAGACTLATVPVVGIDTWRDWLKIGEIASGLYNVDDNWVFLSRDLLGIPRRMFQDFSLERSLRDRFPAKVAGWALLAFVLEVTVRMAALRRRQLKAVDGPIPAFLLLSAWMLCFHFMYYDVYLTALPVMLLFTEPAIYLKPHLLVVMPLAQRNGSELDYFGPGLAAPPTELPSAAPQFEHLWIANSFVMTLLAALAIVDYAFPPLGVHGSVKIDALRDMPMVQPMTFTTDIRGQPTHTVILAALWVWCAVQWARMKPAEERR